MGILQSCFKRERVFDASKFMKVSPSLIFMNSDEGVGLPTPSFHHKE